MRNFGVCKINHVFRPAGDRQLKIWSSQINRNQEVQKKPEKKKDSGFGGVRACVCQYYLYSGMAWLTKVPIMYEPGKTCVI